MARTVFAVAAAGGVAAALLVPAGVMGLAGSAGAASMPTCGARLTESVTLTADLDCSAYGGPALRIGGRAITVDLNGFTLDVGRGRTGIKDDGYSGLLVTGGLISGGSLGIYLDDTARADVSAVQFDDNTSPVSTANMSEGSDFTDDQATDDGYEFELEYGAGNAISSSTSTNAADGMLYLKAEDGDSVIGNSSAGSASADEIGYTDNSGSDQLYVSNSSHGDATGFELYNGIVSVADNTATDDTATGFDFDDNYSTTSDGQSAISGNVSDGNGVVGFYDQQSDGSVWDDNTADGNGVDGFMLDRPASETLQSNTADDNRDAGFYLEDNLESQNVEVFAHDAADDNGRYGIYADYGVDGTADEASHNPTANCVHVVCHRRKDNG